MKETEEYEILDAIYNAHKPVGASYLAPELSYAQATIGRRLRELEDKGLLKSEGRKGRVLAEDGYAHYERIRKAVSVGTDINKLTRLIEKAPYRTLMEIVDIRRQLEGLAVVLACRNATEEQLKELEKISLLYEEAVITNLPSSVLDLSFHLTIARISGNSTLYRMIKILLTMDNANVIFHRIAEELENSFKSIIQHKNIMQAILNRDEEDAQEKLGIHLEKVRKDINTRYGHD